MTEEVEVNLYVHVECPLCDRVMRVEEDSQGKFLMCFCHSTRYEYPRMTLKIRER